MCGIFGVISPESIKFNEIQKLAHFSLQRGRDSSGFLAYDGRSYLSKRANFSIEKLLSKERPNIFQKVFLGHSRLITNDFSTNQPVTRNNISVVHNGIIVNSDEVWTSLETSKTSKIDSEVIIGITLDFLKSGQSIDSLASQILSQCQGTISAALALLEYGKLILFSNNGSLFVGYKDGSTYFASERYFLSAINCANIRQINSNWKIFDIPISKTIESFDFSSTKKNPIPSFKNFSAEESLLLYPKHNLRRCSKCILPETMPFIEFDVSGVCNFCKSYKSKTKPKPKDELLSLVNSYRRNGESDCIVPFSGGRDSCWSLHLIVNELKMKPITYTYDWGMVTDLGRRNISRMCSSLGVENIIIAADIEKKRKNIALNLKAWLKSPDLGMISILTAGDKHFFRHVETVKRTTGISLNLWGVNPLEVTHFKSGFLGVEPDFKEKKVYISSFSKQLNYQKLRFKAMLRSPSYFNSSLWDTFSGEYYRSFMPKSDYYHIFDYWAWNEDVCDRVLSTYDWEFAEDTTTTWRIGDGTAAFYNYIYYLVAGFTEHDTFRSNQIREGQISRSSALDLVSAENLPRYKNIRWYLDVVGMDFCDVISGINRVPRLYSETI